MCNDSFYINVCNVSEHEVPSVLGETEREQTCTQGDNELPDF